VKARGAYLAAAVTVAVLAIAGPVLAASGNDKSPNPQWAGARALTCAAMQSGLRTDYNRPTILVAQSSCQWQAAMAVLAANGSLETNLPEPEPDGVDWTRQTAVVVAMGRVPYGYNLAVLGAGQAAGILLLNVHVDYQSNENNLDDVTPATVVVVDGQGLNSVQVLYDLALPGLLDQATVVPCGTTRINSRLGRMSANLGTNTGPEPSMTWGGVKSAYR
jgi:hypothetical protein